MTIVERLFELQDEKYRQFHHALVPTAPADYIIGVRMPQLRQLAKEIEPTELLTTLPHRYYEEYQLHAILISGMKDYDECLLQVNRLLPYIDNWATCDCLRPQCFAKHTEDLQPHIRIWLTSQHEYTVRFAIGMLEAFCLENNTFHPEHLQLIASIHREEYYIKMMQAWYFATALAKQWDTTLPIISTLPEWVRRKSIQKACESFRVTDFHKQILRSC